MELGLKYKAENKKIDIPNLSENQFQNYFFCNLADTQIGFGLKVKLV